MKSFFAAASATLLDIISHEQMQCLRSWHLCRSHSQLSYQYSTEPDRECLLQAPEDSDLQYHSESFHRFPAHAENQKWSPILRNFRILKESRELAEDRITHSARSHIAHIRCRVKGTASSIVEGQIIFASHQVSIPGVHVYCINSNIEAEFFKRSCNRKNCIVNTCKALRIVEMNGKRSSVFSRIPSSLVSS